MERYAPTVKDLAPRDMVSRAIFQEIKEGRGAGPNRDAVWLDVRHLPREVIEEKLPDVTEFARVYLGVEPTTELVPDPADRALRDGRHPDRRRRAGRGRRGRDPGPRPVRGGRVRVRERARRQPPRDELAARHRRVRPARRQARRRVLRGRRPARSSPSAPRASVARHWSSGLVGPARGRERRRHPRRAPGARCRTSRSSCGPRRACGRCRRSSGGLRERFERVYVQDTGKLFNTELMEVVELGFLLDCADALVAAALARDESRGGHYREDHPLRDDANWLKHSLAYREERRVDPAGAQAGEAGPLRADGAEVLMTDRGLGEVLESSDLARGRRGAPGHAHAQDPPVQPGGPRRGVVVGRVRRSRPIPTTGCSTRCTR